LQKTFFEFLKNKKLRNTVERSKIMEVVCHTKEPFTLEMIGQQLEEQKFHVSRASVYNTIMLLMEAQIVVRHQFTSAIVQYELKCIAEQHSHLICTHCGTVRKIKNDKLKTVFNDNKIPKFTVEYYTLYIYGICSKCKYRQIQQTAQANRKLKQNYRINEES
jgi:Fur family ferric uptake transcriptional regulator